MEPTTNPTGEYLQEEETLETRHERKPEKGKTFAERTPEEVKQSVKEKVRKGIASVAGALEGLNEEVEQDHLPEKTERAVKNVGETTRKVASAARDETRQTRDSLKGATHETSTDAAGAEQETQTREPLPGATPLPGLEKPASAMDEPIRRKRPGQP